MPRISKEKSQEKQSFVMGLLATNPSLTIREIQEKLKETFNQTMNPATILTLRKSVTTGTDSPAVTPEPPMAAEAATPPTPVEAPVDMPIVVASAPAVETAPDASAMEKVPVVQFDKPAAPPVTPVTPVVTTFEQVTTVDDSGRAVTHFRHPVDSPPGTEVEIRPGVTEVVPS